MHFLSDAGVQLGLKVRVVDSLSLAESVVCGDGGGAHSHKACVAVYLFPILILVHMARVAMYLVAVYLSPY